MEEMNEDLDRDIFLDINSNIDPDINFHLPSIICEYYDQDQFANEYTSNTDLKILHINSRSLAKNIDDIRQYINLLRDKFPIIGISESWLTDITDPLVMYWKAKISKNVGVMHRLKLVLPTNILLTLYNSLILPYLNYAILNWGSSTASQCNKLLLLQKKAVRIINKTGYREHTDPLFAELKVLKFIDLYNLNLGKFMFRYKSGLLPSSFNDLFILCSSVHTYGTRSASKGDFYTNYN